MATKVTPGVKFYSYDPEDGFDTHATADEAEAAAESSLDHLLDGDSGWHEGVLEVEWGIMLQSGFAIETNRREAPEGSGFDYMVDHTVKGCRNELDELKAELARIRQQLNGLAEHFDEKAVNLRNEQNRKEADGAIHLATYYGGVAYGYKQAAAHVLGIVKGASVDE